MNKTKMTRREINFLGCSKYDIFSVRSNFISLMITKSVIFTRHVDTPFMKMVFAPRENTAFGG